MNIPVIQSHKAKQGEDPAASIALTQLRYAPPSIKSSNNQFVWPFGAEGFRRYGSATLGIHKYLGAGNVSVQVIHLDEAHIELTGTFPGLTSTQFMEQLLAVITADGSKDLFVPGIFSRIQRVFAESYDFTHDKDERTHSIDYTIDFVRTTVGASIPAAQKTASLTNTSSFIPSTPKNTSASVATKSSRVYSVTGNSQSLREIAGVVYGDINDWTRLIDLNKEVIQIYNPETAILPFQLPTMRLPIGTQIVY